MGRPGIAAALSALLPGLGQAWLGLRRRGLVISLPMVTALVVAGTAAALDPRGSLDTILRPGVLVGVLVLIVAAGAYHLLAVVDAFRVGSRTSRAAPDAPDPHPGPVRPHRSPLFVMALAGVVALYGAVELVGVRAYQAAQAIFVDPGTGFEIPEPSFTIWPSPTPGPAPTGGTTEPPGPAVTPVPVPAWAVDGRLNLLLIGSDAGPGRWLARTDTMVVLSVGVGTGRAALFGIPRNLRNVPLPPESAAAFRNGRFPDLLNALYVYAVGHPRYFPGGDAAGFRAISGAIQELVGQPLDGAIVVNLNGFVDLVDAVGGLWVDIPSRVYDARYPLPNGRGSIEVSIPAGCRRLDGERALQYARSRHMDSDYGRMARQQRVLVALARQLDPIALLPEVPHLLEIARDNLWTTIQPNEVAELAVLAARVGAADIQQIRFSPPEYPEFLDTTSIQRIRERFASVFDLPGASPSPAPAATPQPCPRP